MIEEAENKMMKPEDVKKKGAVQNIGEAYFFPEHGISVTASSLEEANEKLQAKLKEAV